MNKHKLAKNTISSLTLQIITIICGFILPRMMLKYYGSEINGLVNSITQFLSMIAFLELGVGAVVQSSLYKPLAEGNLVKQSEIYASAHDFFSRLAKILLVYVCVLIIIYPHISNQDYGEVFTGTLVVVMSISSFAQYYFGIVNSLFLTADQKGYIQYNVQIVTLIVNTIFCLFLMKLGCSIHFVKLSTSLIYLIRPLYLNEYVKRNYHINRKIKYSEEPIKQKWNGIAQHIAAIVLDGTDTVVLTVFADLKSVSVYSVYYLVVSGIKQLFNAVTSGIQALLGDLYAREERKSLLEAFEFCEWVIHNSAMLIMGCVANLITPFVLLYTSGIHDANYNQRIFGYILTFAYAMYCLRLPYHMMVRASGKYKETQNNYIISAILNLVISILMIKKLGLTGVAIGTFIAMTFQTIGLALYNAKKILHVTYESFIKRMLVDGIIIIIGMFVSLKVNCDCYNFGMWIVLGIKIMLIWFVTIFIINLFFYNKYIAFWGENRVNSDVLKRRK